MFKLPFPLPLLRVPVFAAGVLALCALAPQHAAAQINSSASSVALTATMAESLTISATPNSISFALVPSGVAVGSAAVAVTTSWVLSASRGTVVLDGYFASASAALSYAGSPAVNIPSSAVLGQVTTGSPTSYTAFTQSAQLGPSGAGLTLWSTAVTSSNRESNRSDNLSLEINTHLAPPAARRHLHRHPHAPSLSLLSTLPSVGVNRRHSFTLREPKMFLRLIPFALLAATLPAQSIQPVIVEYKSAADGKFTVTNNALTPMVVVLEPRSFDITDEGKGLYRDLDPHIHVDLSAMSFTLQPGEAHYVFYKASADRLPAWFTVYATFSSPHHSDGLDVRLMLPHTVYLYGKPNVEQREVQLSHVSYDLEGKRLTGTLFNASAALIRVQSVKATSPHSGGKANDEAGGFPLLPGRSRRFELAWKEPRRTHRRRVQVQQLHTQRACHLHLRITLAMRESSSFWRSQNLDIPPTQSRLSAVPELIGVHRRESASLF